MLSSAPDNRKKGVKSHFSICCSRCHSDFRPLSGHFSPRQSLKGGLQRANYVLRFSFWRGGRKYEVVKCRFLQVAYSKKWSVRNRRFYFFSALRPRPQAALSHPSAVRASSEPFIPPGWSRAAGACLDCGRRRGCVSYRPAPTGSPTKIVPLERFKGCAPWFTRPGLLPVGHTKSVVCASCFEALERNYFCR